MKNKLDFKKAVITVISGLSLTLVLTSCGIVSPLSDEEKFKNINQITDVIQYETAGKVIKEERDSSGTTLEPTNLIVYLEGEAPFGILEEKISQISGIDCSRDTESKALACSLEQVSIMLTVQTNNEEGTSYTDLTISDPKSGR